MTLRVLAWVIEQIVEESVQKVGPTMELGRSDLDRLSLGCQWEKV